VARTARSTLAACGAVRSPSWRADDAMTKENSPRASIAVPTWRALPAVRGAANAPAASLAAAGARKASAWSAAVPRKKSRTGISNATVDAKKTRRSHV